ncbi:MAG: hypothetical protein HYT16_00040 [DPANN group archaeon]|nr:hypothetical protein [DPANN group archaeon]
MSLTGFVVRVLPINTQKGRLAEIVLQTEQGPATMQIDAPQIITTGKLSPAEAEAIKQRLSAYPFSELNLTTMQVPYASDKYHAVLHVFGDRDKIKEVMRRNREIFRTISVNEWLKWHTNFPFAKVDVGKFTGGQATLEELLACGDCALDIETNKKVACEEELANPDILYTEVNTAVYARRDVSGALRKEIVTTLDSGEGEIGGAVLHLISSGKVGETLDGIMRIGRVKSNTLWLHTFNGMSFDLLSLRELEDGEFGPAQYGDEPKITAHVGDFSKRVEIKDFIVLDYYAFARQFLQFLPEKNLEAVCKFTGLEFTKALGYDVLGRLIFRAQHGDRQAARTAIDYARADTEVLFSLGDIFKPVIAKIAQGLETSPEAVCATSKKQNAFRLWARRDFCATNVLASEYMTNTFREFDFLEEKLGLFNPGEICRPKAGLHKGTFYIVYLNTLSPVFDFVQQEPLADAAASSTDLERYLYLHALDAVCEQPLFDINGRIPDKVFYAKYGQAREYTKRRLADMQKEARYFLDINELRIANYSKHIVVLEGRPGLESTIAASGSFALLGTSQALFNFGAEEFLTQINRAFVSSGISVSGRRGDRMRFERESIPNLLKQIVMHGNYETPLQYVYEQLAKPLADGTIGRKLLLFEKKVKREVSEMAITTHNRKSVKAQRVLKAPAGKTICWGYSNSLPVAEQDFLKPETPIDYKFYRKHLFGGDSALYRILSALYNPDNNKERRTAMKHILCGRSDMQDWRTLGVTQPLQNGQARLFT